MLNTQTNRSITGLMDVRNLGKTVATSSGPLTILTDINLLINAGESLAIIGASGSGKLMRLGLSVR